MNHNGGRSQANVGGVNGVEYPLLNKCKSGDGWRWTLTTALPNILSSDGYPQSTPSQRLLTGVTADAAKESTDWVYKWSGSGSTRLDPGAPGFTVLEGASFVSGGTGFNILMTGVDGRVKFRCNGAGIGAFYFEDSTVGNSISNARLVRADYETRLDNGEVYNPDLITRLRRMNVGKLRLMPYTGDPFNGINGCNALKWAYRPQTTSFSYGQDLWHAALWAGTTGGTGAAYTCSKPSAIGAAWADKDVVQAKVHTASTVAAPTLTPAGLASKTIKDKRGNALSAGDITLDVATFVYDSVLDCLLYWGGVGLNGGVPLEYQIDLCNQVGAHGHFVLPHLVDDDYITQFATLINSRLDSSLFAYVEYSNEMWNFASAFHQTGWAYNRGLAASIPDADNRPLHYVYAKRFKEMVNIVQPILGSRLRAVIGVQMAGNPPQYDTYRFQGTDAGQSAPTRAIDLAYDIEAATYFYGTKCKQFDFEYAADANLTALTGWADDYASGNATLMTSALANVDADVRSSSFSEDLHGFTTSYWPGWHAKAVIYSRKFAEYEGALAIIAPSTATCTALGISTTYGGTTGKIGVLFEAYKNSALAKATTLYHYNQFVAQANGEFPSQFTIAGGEWACMSNLYDTPYQVETAIEEFNAVSASLLRGSSPSTELQRARIAWHLEDLKEEVEPLTARRLKPAARKARATKVEMPRTQFATAIGGHDEIEEASELCACGVYRAALAEIEEEVEQHRKPMARQPLGPAHRDAFLFLRQLDR